MSNGEESDEHNKKLMEDMMIEHHDLYIQWIINKIEDPDYDQYPILIDSDRVVYPSSVDDMVVIRALKAAVKFMQVKAGVD